MSIDDVMVANFYGDVAGQITTADPKDETGFASKASAKKRFADFQNQLQEFGRNRDNEGAISFVEKTLKE